MSTGSLNVTSGHPPSVSFVNVALASSVPSAAHRFPTCVPVFPAPLKNRSPYTYPPTSLRNRTPTSTDLSSSNAGFACVAALPQMLHSPLDVVVIDYV